jgi:uncharacterized protein (DUF305 family)
MFFSLFRRQPGTRAFQATDRVAGVRLRVSQLEDRVNPSHVVDLSPAAWGPPDAGGGRPALVSPVSAGPGAEAAAAPTTAQARYEVKFLTDMIDHHMMAVMTGELCAERAVHEELRALCEDIVAAQKQEIEMMQSWLRDWYGVAYEPRMSPGMERHVEKLAALEGEEFEIAFMEMMIDHHEGAIREGTRCVERGYHEELVDLCHNIVQVQTEEIELMQSWLSEWYGIEG